MSTRFYVTTGPESSGKTTLAGQLADYYRAPLVTEISREYLQKKMSAERHWRYDQNDLLTIAKQQNQLELNLGAYDPQAIVCDTDLLVLIVWSEVKYGISDPWINKTFAQVRKSGNPRHYLLCDWQIPWQPDPLRENPDNRDELFRLYLEKLDYFELPYTIVKGDVPTRLQLATKALA